RHTTELGLGYANVRLGLGGCGWRRNGGLALFSLFSWIFYGVRWWRASNYFSPSRKRVFEQPAQILLARRARWKLRATMPRQRSFHQSRNIGTAVANSL